MNQAMFFQPPDEESQSINKPTQSSVRRRRKKKFTRKNKQKSVRKDALKKRPLRLALTMSSWAESFTHAATWQLKHQISYWKSRAKALEYENRILHDIIRKNCTDSGQEHPEASSVECVSEFDSRPEDEEELADDTDVQEDPEDQENFEVSEEFIQFLTANAKYKEEARREREKLKRESNEIGIIEEMEAGPPEERVDNEETMKELYGDKWQRIAALEMTLQSQFIKNTDSEKPMYWPNIPFNFNFS